MKNCEVEATFTTNGMPRPQKLHWDGQTLLIIETGRRWSDADGQHVLARVQDGRTFELVYKGSTWQGQVASKSPSAV